MRTMTLKTASLRIFGALLVLGVLGANVPRVRAEDPLDRVADTGRYQAELFQQTVSDYEQLRQQSADLVNSGPDAQAAAPAAGAVAAPGQAPAVAPAAVPQIINLYPAQAVPQQPPIDPVAFAQMVRQNQARVQQRILEGQQQILQRQQEIFRQHQLLTMGMYP